MLNSLKELFKNNQQLNNNPDNTTGLRRQLIKQMLQNQKITSASWGSPRQQYIMAALNSKSPNMTIAQDDSVLSSGLGQSMTPYNENYLDPNEEIIVGFKNGVPMVFRNGKLEPW